MSVPASRRPETAEVHEQVSGAHILLPKHAEAHSNRLSPYRARAGKARPLRGSPRGMCSDRLAPYAVHSVMEGSPFTRVASVGTRASSASPPGTRSNTLAPYRACTGKARPLRGSPRDARAVL